MPSSKNKQRDSGNEVDVLFERVACRRSCGGGDVCLAAGEGAHRWRGGGVRGAFHERGLDPPRHVERDGAGRVRGIPAGETLMSVIAVGKAAAKPIKVPRKPVAEVLKTA